MEHMRNPNGIEKYYPLSEKHFRPDSGIFPVRVYPNMNGGAGGLPI